MTPDKERITCLLEKVAVLEQFTQACQLLTSAWSANDAFQGRLIEKLTDRIESLEADNLGMGEGEIAARLDLMASEERTDRLRNALMQIQTQSLALCQEWIGQARVDVDIIHKTATAALNYREANPKETTDDD